MISLLASTSLLGIATVTTVTPTVNASAHKSQAHLPYSVHRMKTFTGITQSMTRLSQNDGEVAPWEGSYLANHDGANISYYLESSSAATQTAWQRAIDNWNNLGVIHLYPVSSPDEATIQLTDTGLNDAITQRINNQHGDDVVGLTQTRSDGTASAELIVKSFQDESMQSFNRSDAWQVQETYDNDTPLDDTATHELGHALGFAHDDDARSDVRIRQIIYESAYRRKQHKWVMVPHEVTYTQKGLEQIMRSGLVFSDNMTQLAPLGQPQVNALRQHYGL